MASSAPSARNALAQPQAIDWSLAMPTMRPLLAFEQRRLGDWDHRAGLRFAALDWLREAVSSASVCRAIISSSSVGTT